jgi:uncharacterized integral membrane protein
MKKVKIILIITILLIALVVSLQNTDTVETKFLLATVTMPRVLLLLLTFTLGLVAGLIIASIILRKPAKLKEKIKVEEL